MTHPYRFIFNHDSSELYHRFSAPIQRQNVLDHIDELDQTQIDTVCWCVASGSMMVAYPSTVAEVLPDVPDTWAGCLNDLWRRGIDPVELVVKRLREQGRRAFLSVRMNDCHHKSHPDGPLASRFWQQHQELRLWDITEGACYYNAALDYSHDIVRQRALDLILDAAGRYQPDGIELDMGRNPFFFLAHEAPAKKDILTGFLQQVRQSLDQLASQQNRQPLQIMIRCPVWESELAAKGMDVAQWMRRRLADVFVMTTLRYNDYHACVEPWRTIAHQAGVLLRPGIEPGPAHNAPAHNHVTHATPEELRGMAQNYWAQDVQGLYLFNFPCLTTQFIRQPRRWAAYRELLTSLASPQTLRRQNKTYPFYTHLPIELELYRPPQYHQSIPLTVREPDLAQDGGRWEIRFRLTGFPPAGGVHYLVNQRRVPDDCIGYSYGSKIAKSRDGYPIDAHQIVTLRLTPDWLINGQNTLGFYLQRGPWGEHSFIYVHEVEVHSLYGASV